MKQIDQEIYISYKVDNKTYMLSKDVFKKITAYHIHYYLEHSGFYYQRYIEAPNDYNEAYCNYPWDSEKYSVEKIRIAIDKTKEFLVGQVQKKSRFDEETYSNNKKIRYHNCDDFDISKLSNPRFNSFNASSYHGHKSYHEFASEIASEIQSYESVDYDKLYERVQKDKELMAVFELQRLRLTTPEVYNNRKLELCARRGCVEEWWNFLQTNLELVFEECFDAVKALDGVTIKILRAI